MEEGASGCFHGFQFQLEWWVNKWHKPHSDVPFHKKISSFLEDQNKTNTWTFCKHDYPLIWNFGFWLSPLIIRFRKNLWPSLHTCRSRWNFIFLTCFVPPLHPSWPSWPRQPASTHLKWTSLSNWGSPCWQSIGSQQQCMPIMNTVPTIPQKKIVKVG